VSEKQNPEVAPRARHVARLPGFVADAPVGLGDVIKHATSSVGVRPCGGCRQRAAALNRWMQFSGPPGRHGR
jgi:hypothetical protein